MTRTNAPLTAPSWKTVQKMERAKVKDIYHLDCRRWFQKSYGNTYFTAQIFKNGEPLHTMPKEYGYGEHCVDQCQQWLHNNGHIKLFKDGKEARWQFTERTGIKITYAIADVSRERDLHA